MKSVFGAPETSPTQGMEMAGVNLYNTMLTPGASGAPHSAKDEKAYGGKR